MEAGEVGDHHRIVLQLVVLQPKRNLEDVTTQNREGMVLSVCSLFQLEIESMILLKPLLNLVMVYLSVQVRIF